MNRQPSLSFSRKPWLSAKTWLLGLVAVAAVGTAQASGVNWSIGIQSPGVAVGVSNSRPVAVYPQPVYAQPVYGAPVYVQPQPVYQVQPVVTYGRPVVVYQPAPVWVPPGHRHDHRRGWRDRDDDRRHWR